MATTDPCLGCRYGFGAAMRLRGNSASRGVGAWSRRIEETTAMLDPMRVLRSFLDAQGAGPLVDTEGLITCLMPVWADLDGARDDAMEPRKLGRLENPEWLPPVLTFVVERHGGTVLGSTRADLQTWTVNLDLETATPTTSGYRQIRPRATRLDVEPLVSEVIGLVVDGADDKRLKWSADHGTVRIAVGQFIPAGGPKQTVGGRRKRFREKLERAMAEAGWAKTGPGTYMRSQPQGG